MNVAVQLKSDASAPVQFQSVVTCQFAVGVTAGAVLSEEDQNVAFTVARPAVASDATGSLFIVAGSKEQVASNSDV